MKLTATEKQYYCPGESHPISRSVHLARMAEFYPKCRECPFNSDTGSLSAAIVQQMKSSQRRKIEPILFHAENIRGIYLNEFNRPLASQIAIAFAQLLWAQVSTATLNPNDKEHDEAIAGGRKKTIRPRPSVVVGYDERLSSPDIYAGVIMGLRKMGCQIIDIGITTATCFRFAVEHLSATAGLYVTGAGCAPSWSGLDIVLAHAQPIPARSDLEQDITLSAIEQRLNLPTNRPTRQPGAMRHYQAILPYESSFRDHFHALRPLKICWATDSALLSNTMQRLFTELPCSLSPVEIPQRLRSVNDSSDSDVQRLQQAVRQQSAHLGILIDSDASRCCFVDDAGQFVPASLMLMLLAEGCLQEQSSCVLVLPADLAETLAETSNQSHCTIVNAGESASDLFRIMRKHNADIGISTDGRFWFGSPVPQCDAVLTLGKVLQALSRSDTPFSELLLQNSAVQTAV